MEVTKTTEDIVRQVLSLLSLPKYFQTNYKTKDLFDEKILKTEYLRNKCMKNSKLIIIFTLAYSN